MLILINGLNASTTDLKSISPEKIKRVEYYTIPPARYHSVSSLINVVTKTLDTDYSLGIEAVHALSTGFGNDKAYQRLVRGNHQWVVDYGLNYRNYTRRHSTSSYKYFALNNLSTTYQTDDSFGYADNQAHLKYIYSNPSSLDVQVTLAPNYEYRHNRGEMNIEDEQNGNIYKRSGKQKGSTTIFSPSLDVYMLKRWGQNKELAIDFTGTYLYNKQKNNEEETDSTLENSQFSDIMQQRLNRFSLIGEVNYMWKQGVSSVNLGYKASWAHDKSTLSNLLSSYISEKYFNRAQSHYVYGEYSGQWKLLAYKGSLGLTYVNNHNSDAKFCKLYVTPQLILMWTLKSQHSLQYLLKGNPELPNIAQLSKNASYVTEFLIKTGSPDLHSGYTTLHSLSHRWHHKWIETTLATFYSYTSSPIFNHYAISELKGNKYITSSYHNFRSFNEYGGVSAVNLSLFNNKLTAKLTLFVSKQTINDGDDYHYSRWYTPVFFILGYKYRNFGISYNGGIASTQIVGSDLQKDENSSHLQAYYQLKNVRIIAGCYWIFTKSKYSSETLPSSLLSHNSQTSINDNKSMIVIGFSWNISSGKKQSTSRKLENHDNDKGVF